MAAVPPHIKIARKAFRDPASGGDPFWNEPRELSRWEAWEWILYATAFTPHAWALRSGQVLELRCAETKPLSVRYLMGAWRWGSKKRVAAFLAQLREMGRIGPGRKTVDGDTYLVLNYEHYQFGGDRADESGDRVRHGSGYTDGDSNGDSGDVGAQGGLPLGGDSNGDRHGDTNGDSGGDKTYTRESKSKKNPSGSARSRRRPVENSEPWTAEAGDLWKDRHDGTANYGRIGKALKPLVDAKGWPDVRIAWEHYLDGQELDFQSCEHFAEHYGEWAGTKQNGKKPADLTPEERDKQLAKRYQDEHKAECSGLWADAQRTGKERGIPAMTLYRSWILERARQKPAAPDKPADGLERLKVIA